MTGLLRALGRAVDRLMHGRPVDMAERLAPYADPFHLDAGPGPAGHRRT